MRSIPSKDETFKRLGSLKELWYEHLHSAILDTSEHYRSTAFHRDDQPGLFSSHVLSRFLTLLEPEAEKYDFSIVPSQGGFHLAYGRFVCKFRKAFSGGIPLPRTKTQLRFYNANCGLSMQPSLPWDEIVQPPLPIGSTVSLIVYYDVLPGKDRELAWVRVACPRFATFNRIETEWDGLLESPLSGEGESFRVEHAAEVRRDLTFAKLEDEDEESIE